MDISITRHGTALGLVLTLAACGGAEDAADTRTDAPPSAPAAETAGAGADCWLRDVSFEEAAQRTSPRARVEIPLGDRTATLCYSRPAARGRTVMGELVPYGQPWRLGADEATQIHVPVAATIGAVRVEPGTYSLYAIAGPDAWEIVVNRAYQRWGIPIDAAVRGDDLGSFTRPAMASSETVESLTFAWEAHGESAGNLVMMWEDVRVEIPVERADG